jgi:hypothetical protein
MAGENSNSNNGGGTDNTQNGGQNNGNGGGDNNQNQNQNGNEQNQNQNGNQASTNNNQNSGEVKLTEEQLAEAFKHPRFQELSKAAQELKTIKAQQDKAKEDKLKEDGKLSELVTEKDQKITTLQQSVINSQLAAVAAQLGIQDLDAVKLADVSNVTLNDDGTVSGAKEAIEALKADKPYLFTTNGKPNVGSGTNPNNGGGETGKVMASQLKDPKFFRDPANQELIRTAMATPGGIIDDLAN